MDVIFTAAEPSGTKRRNVLVEKWKMDKVKKQKEERLL